MIERYEDDRVTLRDSKLFTYLLKLVEMRVVDVDKVFLVYYLCCIYYIYYFTTHAVFATCFFIEIFQINQLHTNLHLNEY